MYNDYLEGSSLFSSKALTMAFILLQHGTVLGHNDGHVIVLKDHDVLIQGNKITEIGQNLTCPDAEGTVIPCRDKIICPGFVDTHHHLWQTQVPFYD